VTKQIGPLSYAAFFNVYIDRMV